MLFALLVGRHGSLLCPASRFTHFACIALQGFAALNILTFHFGYIPFSHSQSTGCPCLARLLVATGFGVVMVFVSMALLFDL
jgi:hypothetical protein